MYSNEEKGPACRILAKPQPSWPLALSHTVSLVIKLNIMVACQHGSYAAAPPQAQSSPALFSCLAVSHKKTYNLMGSHIAIHSPRLDFLALFDCKSTSQVRLGAGCVHFRERRHCTYCSLRFHTLGTICSCLGNSADLSCTSLSVRYFSSKRAATACSPSHHLLPSRCVLVSNLATNTEHWPHGNSHKYQTLSPH